MSRSALGAVGLTLADGSRWGIVATAESLAETVRHLATVMRLSPESGETLRLLMLTEGTSLGLTTPASTSSILDGGVSCSTADWPPSLPDAWSARLVFECDDAVAYALRPSRDDKVLALQLLQLALVICARAEARGGLLVHGALAEHHGQGVILAGPGGAGKTTASSRLPPGWSSLSDDVTLVVRGKDGTYWAHPWPTWSRPMLGDQDGSWDVQNAVLLRGVFFVVQAGQDCVEPVAETQAACMLVESSEQAWWGMQYVQDRAQARRLRLQRFDSICALAKNVPCHLLHLSLTGRFWERIEQALAGDGMCTG